MLVTKKTVMSEVLTAVLLIISYRKWQALVKWVVRSILKDHVAFGFKGMDCMTLEDKSTVIHWNVWNHSPSDTASQHWRSESLMMKMALSCHVIQSSLFVTNARKNVSTIHFLLPAPFYCLSLCKKFITVTNASVTKIQVTQLESAPLRKE